MRKTIELEEGWLFQKTEYGCQNMPDLSDGRWEKISVPHDWAISGEFSPENDPQPLESSVLDYHEGMIQIGRTGGLPIKGTGWYVLDLFLPGDYAFYSLEFDGIMNHGEVYINGRKAGERPYGYSSFSVDLVPYMKRNEKNRIVVKVNSMDKTSRWYPGAGIYRPVRLVMKEECHVKYQGIWVRSEYDWMSRTALVKIHCEIEGNGVPEHVVFAPDGSAAAKASGMNAEIQLEEVWEWSIESPQLYTLVTEIKKDGHTADRVCTRFGIRKTEFIKDNGFFLNGSRVEIKGVCLHHDFGMLGAAYRRSVARQRLLMLKEMGCNAIRTTHNPPCPQTLDLCDEIGILVLEEAFDVWHISKALNDYANEFMQWAEKDLTDMIHRDRNHPCIFLYSIGNEIPDQVQKDGRDTCRWLTKICHQEDDSRLVTCGFNRPKAAIENGLTEEVDVVGLNYSPAYYEEYHKDYPHWNMIATETCSSVSSRGEYYLTAQIEVPPTKHENLQVNSYDYSAVACAYIPDVEFEAQKKAPFVAGQFVWTGFDYLGEPTPYREEWPSRSSYFGIFDLAGMKKDRYYAYKANWSEEPVLHLFPHWNWNIGDCVDVHCYTNLDYVRLFLNGKELIGQKRNGHRIIWSQIPYEPGELKAVGYKNRNDQNGIILEEKVQTSKEPYALRFIWKNRPVYPDGKDVIFSEVHVVDQDGILCPNAAVTVFFEVNGNGQYLASDGGDATDLRPFAKPYCRTFHGKVVCAVGVGEEEGFLIIRAKAEGLKSAELIIDIKR